MSATVQDDQPAVPMRTAALWYGRTGIPIFPLYGNRNGVCECPKGIDCGSPAKHPRTPDGFKSATTDEDTIALWWGKWPTSNIGIPTGRPMTFDVIDVDDRDAYRELVDAVGEPKTIGHFRTGKGDHYLVRPSGQRNLAGGKTSVEGIDVRGDGGYIVAPPSLHISGVRYERVRWNPDAPTGDIEWPDFYAELQARAPRTEAAPRPMGDPFWDQFALGSGDPANRAAAVVDRAVEMLRLSTEGNRQYTLATDSVWIIARLLNSPGMGPLTDSILADAVPRLSRTGLAIGLEPAECDQRLIRRKIEQARERAEALLDRAGPVSDSQPFSPLVESDHTGEKTAPLTLGDAYAAGLTPTMPPEDRLPFDGIRYGLESEAVRRKIREIAAAAEAADFPAPLDLDAERGDHPWIIDGMLHRKGFVLLSAEAKAGKTTLLLNIAKALTSDDGLFLGDYDYVQGGPYRVAILDYEMPDDDLRDWLNGLGVNRDRIRAWSLRGRESALPITSPTRRQRIAEQIAAFEPDVLIVDPLGPMLNALGYSENDNSEVGHVLTSLMEFALTDCGVDLVLAAHHLGKQPGQGPRGASRFSGAPDALWELTRDDADHSALRIGRGRNTVSGDHPMTLVEVEGSPVREVRLAAAQPSASILADTELANDVIEAALRADRSSARAIRDKITGHRSKAVGDMVKRLEADGVILRADNGWTVDAEKARTYRDQNEGEKWFPSGASGSGVGNHLLILNDEEVVPGSETPNPRSVERSGSGGSRWFPSGSEPEPEESGSPVPVPNKARTGTTSGNRSETATGEGGETEDVAARGSGICRDCGGPTGAAGFVYCRDCVDSRKDGGAK